MYYFQLISIFKLIFVNNYKFELAGQDLSWTFHTFKAGIGWKSFHCSSGGRVLKIQEFRKICWRYWFFFNVRIHLSILLRIYSVDFVLQTHSQKFNYGRVKTNQGVTFSMLASESLLSETSKWCFQFWDSSIFHLIFLRSNMLNIIHQGRTQKFETYQGIIDWKNVSLTSWFGVLMVT